MKLIRAVRDFNIAERYPFVLEGLKTLHREIGEVIKKEGRAAKAPAANMDIFEATEGTEATNG